MVSDFMLRQRKLLEETKKNKGVPPIKSIYTPDNYKPIARTAFNQLKRFNQNAKPAKTDPNPDQPPRMAYPPRMSDPSQFMLNQRKLLKDLKENKATTPDRAPYSLRPGLSRFSDEGVDIKMDPDSDFAKSIAPQDIPISQSNQVTPDKTISALNNPANKPEIDPAARHMANMRNDKLGQGDPNYHRVGNMDVTFDDDVSPEARKRFLAPTGRGATFEERGFFGNSGRVPVGWRGMPPKQMRNAGNALPSKEGLNRHQYQQVLENQGKLDVQNARNLSSLASDETAITTQGMRTQGLRDIAKANQGSLQNRAQIKNAQDMKNRESKNLKTQYDIIGTRLKEDLTLSADERLKLQKQQDGIGKLLNSSLQTSGQIAQRKAFEAQAAKY